LVGRSLDDRSGC